MKDYKILSDLIKINTIKDKDNLLFMRYCIDYLKKFNFEIKEINNNGKIAIIATRGSNPRICFVGHTDTVDYNDKWETNPFELTKKENKLYGLGVCDMKGSIAAFLETIAHPGMGSRSLQVVLTYDEELNFEGIKSIKKYNNLLSQNIVIGEPTNNEVLYGSKGCMEFEIEFYGKSCHSSLKPQGVSAIEECIKFTKDLNRIVESLSKENNDLFEIPYVTSNIGIINGGTAINVVPNKCTIKFDFRTINQNQNIIIQHTLEQLIKKYNCNMKKTLDIIPMQGTKYGELMRNLFVIKDKNSKPSFFGACDGNFIKDKDICLLGPGPINCHVPNEYITEESYEQLKKQYLFMAKVSTKYY